MLVVAAIYGVGAAPTAIAQTPPKPPPTELQLLPAAEFLELRWSDAEDTVHGAIRPARPSTAEPIQVTVKVGTFQGEDFQGPVTISLRRASERVSQERTVPWSGQGWSTEFEVSEGGTYELDVAFRTTRHKTLRARFDVFERVSIPKAARWGVLLLIAAVVIGFGVRMALRTPSVGAQSRPP